MRTYSVSQIRLWDECPLAWKLKYLDKVPEEPSRILEAGAAAHAAIAVYLTRCHAAGLPSDAALVDPSVDEARVDGAPIGATYRADVRALLAKLAGSFAVELRAPAIEQRLGFTADWAPCGFFADDVRFRGVMDLYDLPAPDVARIVDWKTGYKVDWSEDAEENLQLRTYGYLATLLCPAAATVRVSLWHVRYGYEQAHDFAAEDLAGVRDDLEARMAEIDAATDFAATPGDHCQRCGFRRQCPVYVASGRTQEIPEDPLALARAFALAKARVKALEGAVKIRVEADGPIDLGRGRLLGFAPSERWSNTDAQGLVTRLLMLGVPKREVWRELGLARTAVVKMLKAARQKAEIDAVLDAFGERQVSTALREHRAGEGGEE